MKELYISPELKLVGLAPAEQLASLSGLELDEALGGAESGSVSNVLPDIGDIDISIGV